MQDVMAWSTHVCWCKASLGSFKHQISCFEVLYRLENAFGNENNPVNFLLQSLDSHDFMGLLKCFIKLPTLITELHFPFTNCCLSIRATTFYLLVVTLTIYLIVFIIHQLFPFTKEFWPFTFSLLVVTLPHSSHCRLPKSAGDILFFQLLLPLQSQFESFMGQPF